MTQKCPVCNGRGMVEKGFYPDDKATKHPECRSCSGTGIVPMQVPNYYPVPYPQPVPVYPSPWRPYTPWRPDFIWTSDRTTAKPPTLELTTFTS